MTFGFIISRHVTSELTNKYWNHCIKQLNTLYPLTQIIIIDDNSNQEFVKEEDQYKNITVIQSEFPGRGELLPYYYFLKNKYFENAVIIHDSVFFHKRIPFELLQNIDKKIVPYSEIYNTYYKHIGKSDIDQVIQTYLKKQNMNVGLVGSNLIKLSIIQSECEKLTR